MPADLERTLPGARVGTALYGAVQGMRALYNHLPCQKWGGMLTLSPALVLPSEAQEAANGSGTGTGTVADASTAWHMTAGSQVHRQHKHVHMRFIKYSHIFSPLFWL